MEQRQQFHVRGLDCAEEIALLRKALGGGPGVRDLAFDLLQSRLVVTYDDAETSIDVIARAVASTGMTSTVWSPRGATVTESWWSRNGRAALTWLSGACLLWALTWHAVISRNLSTALQGESPP